MRLKLLMGLIVGLAASATFFDLPQTSLQKITSLQPVETGDPFLQKLVEDWHQFSTKSPQLVIKEVKSKSPGDLVPKHPMAPVKTGDPFFDDLITDWHQFSNDTAEDSLQTLKHNREHRGNKIVERTQKLQSELKPANTGFPFLDALADEWHEFAFGWAYRLVNEITEVFKKNGMLKEEENP